MPANPQVAEELAEKGFRFKGSSYDSRQGYEGQTTDTHEGYFVSQDTGEKFELTVVMEGMNASELGQSMITRYEHIFVGLGYVSGCYMAAQLGEAPESTLQSLEHYKGPDPAMHTFLSPEGIDIDAHEAVEHIRTFLSVRNLRSISFGEYWNMTREQMLSDGLKITKEDEEFFKSRKEQ